MVTERSDASTRLATVEKIGPSSEASAASQSAFDGFLTHRYRLEPVGEALPGAHMNAICLVFWLAPNLKK
jgi:hypothetical protein